MQSRRSDAITRFEARFELMECAAKDEGSTLQAESLETLEARWQEAKRLLSAGDLRGLRSVCSVARDTSNHKVIRKIPFICALSC